MGADETQIWRRSTIRAWLVGVGLAVSLILVVSKLVQIQVLQHEEYTARYQGIARQEMDLHARRGTVTDRTGRELAVDRPAIAVYVHPQRLKDIPGTSARLAAILGASADDLERRIRKHKGGEDLNLHRLVCGTGG